MNQEVRISKEEARRVRVLDCDLKGTGTYCFDRYNAPYYKKAVNGGTLMKFWGYVEETPTKIRSTFCAKED